MPNKLSRIMKQVQYIYFFLFFLKIFTSDRSIAREFLGIFLVITLPAAIVELAPILIGAIIEQLEPTKTLFSIIVLFFFLPS